MTLSEAAKQCNSEYRCIARKSWARTTREPCLSPVVIEPTNSPCKCVVWVLEKNTISEWVPTLDDLIADDWFILKFY